MSLKILSITVLLFMGSLRSTAAGKYAPMGDMVGESCCYVAQPYVGEPIVECIKQRPTRVKVESGDWYCITSDSPWMKQQIQKGKVSC
ncbi:Hypothetical predicted protein [Xyrichtys novacula]|uniref:Chemokine n=1 Tax=Xyrichtys novacula TaxID=13765 RepID=A0AAV1H8F4_XYRNO|nr:Hypothetical predicted protein [Xyrichtys novacula]